MHSEGNVTTQLPTTVECKTTHALCPLAFHVSLETRKVLTTSICKRLDSLLSGSFRWCNLLTYTKLFTTFLVQNIILSFKYH